MFKVMVLNLGEKCMRIVFILAQILFVRQLQNMLYVSALYLVQ